MKKISFAFVCISLMAIPLMYNNCSNSAIRSAAVSENIPDQILNVGAETETCAEGSVAVGYNTSTKAILCAPLQSIGSSSCSTNQVLYSQSNSETQCLDLTYTSQAGTLCPVGEYMTQFVAPETIVCSQNPGVASVPAQCPGGQVLVAVQNGQPVCQPSNVSQPSLDVSCGAGEYLVAVQNGQAICRDVNLSSNTLSCPSGQAIVGFSNGGVTCQNLMAVPTGDSNCSSGQFLQNSMGNSADFCLDSPEISLAHSCPVGTYLQSITQGEFNCVSLPSSGERFNGTCPINQYISGYAGGAFVCSEYSNQISVGGVCPSGHFVHGIQSGVTICVPFPTVYSVCTPGTSDFCVDHVNSSVGTKTCNAAGDGYGVCGDFTGCLPGFNFSNGQCTAQNTCQQGQVCPIENGFGAISCNNNVESCTLGTCKFGYKASNGACILSCPAGYENQNEVCVDITNPVIEWVTRPSLQVSATGAVTSFSYRTYDQESGVEKVECQINGGAFAPCTNDILVGLGMGTHTVNIRAVDRAGNMASISDSWTITECQGGQSITQMISNGVCTKTCSASGSYPSSCSQISCQTGFSQVNGQCLDQDPPVITWLTVPPAQVTAGSLVSVDFRATDASQIVTLECRREDTAFTSCNLVAVDRCAPGDHFIEVRAVDIFGNTTTERKSWTAVENNLVPHARCKVWQDGCGNTCSRTAADLPFVCTKPYCSGPATPQCTGTF